MSKEYTFLKNIKKEETSVSIPKETINIPKNTTEILEKTPSIPKPKKTKTKPITAIKVKYIEDLDYIQLELGIATKITVLRMLVRQRARELRGK